MASVILPFYNGAKAIRGAVESILAQTYTTFEFIIINDGSTDKTSAILASFHDKRIKVLHQENRGLVTYYSEPDSILRRRSVSMRIKQQVLSRIEVIRKLNLGYADYLNIPLVVVLSILNRLGVRLDGIFNFLSRASDLKT